MHNNSSFIFVVIILIGSCKENSVPQDWLVQIDSVVVKKEEFLTRMNYNPYLKAVQNNTNAKKIALSSIIVEKLLYLESASCQKCDMLSEAVIYNNLRENIIEQIRMDSVETSISISENELKKEFLKSLYDLKIKFVVFYDQKDLETVRSEIKNGLSFESASLKYMRKMGWQKFSIPEKNVKWSDEKTDFENKLYSLKVGEVSEPLAARAEMYLVKLIDKTENGQNTLQEFDERKSALQSRIRKEKIAERYSVFYRKHLIPFLAMPEWAQIHKILDLIVNEIDFSGTEKLSENKTIGDQLYLTAIDKIENYKQKRVLIFQNGNYWNAVQLLSALKNGPYFLNFKSEIAFRRSFAQNIELLTEHEALFEFAKGLGYNDNRQVKEKHASWKSFYRANAFRYTELQKLENKISGNTPIQQRRTSGFDSLIVNALSKHTIKINNKVINEIVPDIQDIVLKKSHFSGRLAEPPLEPLSGFPKWNRSISDLLKGVH